MELYYPNQFCPQYFTESSFFEDFDQYESPRVSQPIPYKTYQDILEEEEAMLIAYDLEVKNIEMLALIKGVSPKEICDSQYAASSDSYYQSSEEDEGDDEDYFFQEIDDSPDADLDSISGEFPENSDEEDIFAMDL